VLLCGESEAGKTESAKLMMRHLALAAGGAGDAGGAVRGVSLVSVAPSVLCDVVGLGGLRAFDVAGVVLSLYAVLLVVAALMWRARAGVGEPLLREEEDDDDGEEASSVPAREPLLDQLLLPDWPWSRGDDGACLRRSRHVARAV
jgi:hypothetical protein